MTLDWWTLGLQTINLLVLVWLLGRFFFRPMAGIIAQRQAAARKLLDDAAAARLKAAEAAKSAQEERDFAVSARAGLMEKAHKEAEQQRKALLDAARKEAEQLRADAHGALARMREEEQASLGEQATLLAIDIAVRLLGRLPAPVPVSEFLSGLEKAISSLPDGARAAIGADGEPVTLAAAYALNEDELTACSKAVARALGRKAELVLRVDPSLIAGVRLEARDAQADNNLRADLDRIAERLNRHDDG